MFGIGGFELFLILLFGFLLFGPDKLPAMAKTLGKAISKFRNAQSEMTTVIKNEVYDPNSDEPFKNPVDAIEKATEAGKRAAGVKTSTSSSAAKTSQGSSNSNTQEKPHVSAKQESFLERKARYEREQAEKAAAASGQSNNSKNDANAKKDVQALNTSTQNSESRGE